MSLLWDQSLNLTRQNLKAAKRLKSARNKCRCTFNQHWLRFSSSTILMVHRSHSAWIKSASHYGLAYWHIDAQLNWIRDGLERGPFSVHEAEAAVESARAAVM